MVFRWTVRTTSARCVIVHPYARHSAAYLRQSIFLTAYETPETRSLFNTLKNVEGKIRTERRWLPVSVPQGIEQVGAVFSLARLRLNWSQEFIQFDCANPQNEADRRFSYFTTQVCVHDSVRVTVAVFDTMIL